MEVKVIAIEQMMPERQHLDDAGADLKADRPCRIAPGTTRMVFTGTRWEIPRGYVGLVFARSSLAVKKGLMLANGFECSECGNVVEDCEGWLVNGVFNYCSKCGAEVVE